MELIVYTSSHPNAFTLYPHPIPLLYPYPPHLPKTKGLQYPLPSQLHLPRRLPRSIPAFTNANGAPLAQLDLVFNSGKGAGAMVGKMDAGEGGGAEVVGAVCYVFC